MCIFTPATEAGGKRRAHPVFEQFRLGCRHPRRSSYARPDAKFHFCTRRQAALALQDLNVRAAKRRIPQYGGEHEIAFFPRYKPHRHGLAHTCHQTSGMRHQRLRRDIAIEPQHEHLLFLDTRGTVGTYAPHMRAAGIEFEVRRARNGLPGQGSESRVDIDGTMHTRPELGMKNVRPAFGVKPRSEEHTSELKSLMRT